MKTGSIPTEPESLSEEIERLDRLIEASLVQAGDVLTVERFRMRKRLEVARSVGSGQGEQRGASLVEDRRPFVKDGVGIDPIKAMRIVFREHGNEISTRELYRLLDEGGAFEGKESAEKAFRSSIMQNVGNQNILQFSAAGKELEKPEIKQLDIEAIFSGKTKIIK